MTVSILNRYTDAVIATVEDTDDLRVAVIRLVRKGVNLSGAYLRGADLSGADLSEAVEKYAKVPSLHRRILAAIDGGGSLQMDAWHKCETTHCRAGWAIHLAGPAGAMLEACVGPVVAGALIHVVSCPQLEGKVPDFYAANEDALEDIKRLAQLEEPITL